jgi:hypothetical protein
MDALGWGNIGLVDFDGALDASKEVTERWQPSCFEMWKCRGDITDNGCADASLVLGPPNRD